MMETTQDLRIRRVQPLLPPCDLLEQLQLGEVGAHTVASGRQQIRRILLGADDRLLVVVGPCSVHDPEAVKDYADLLGEAARRHGEDLLIVMRTYLEKPRTTVGWKGLIHDPSLDGRNDVNAGLRVSRSLLCELAEMGMFAATEFLDPLAAQYFADLVCWGAIGARTAESQIHRQLASGLSMSIGFKNGTDGDVQVAIDAMRAAAHSHRFLGMANDGRCVLVETEGNRDTHVVLRGGRSGPNFAAPQVDATVRKLHAAGLPGRVMIDCSHANSGKDYRAQSRVAAEVGEQIAAGSDGVMGIMLESFLFDGRQEIGPLSGLRYGQSVTDACMGWLPTELTLERLADAVRRRRSTRAARESSEHDAVYDMGRPS